MLGFLFGMRELAASSMLQPLNTEVVATQLLFMYDQAPIGTMAAFAALLGVVGIAVAGGAMLLTRRFLWGAHEGG